MGKTGWGVSLKVERRKVSGIGNKATDRGEVWHLPVLSTFLCTQDLKSEHLYEYLLLIYRQKVLGEQPPEHLH